MQGDPYAGLEPEALWRHFAALNAIPRPSGHEAAVREYVRGVAEAAGATWETDAGGNAIVRVAPKSGYEGPAVAIQSHLDMVCESAPGVEHDCERSPIVPQRDGDRITARGTTLGADNGIGVAIALVLLSDPAAVHGPLELLFTVEEETGLHGAANLDVSTLRAEALINLDSEDDRALTVGCAGGADVELTLPVDREPTPGGRQGAELRVSGLSGGHSGMQIHERHANAIKLAAAALDGLQAAGVEFRVGAIDGGSAHNAIPRHASARLAVAGEAPEEQMEQIVAELRREWAADEPELTIDLAPAPPPDAVLSPGSAATLIGLLRELPHGVLAMSERFEDTVETSSNLAVVRTGSDLARVVASVRSMKADALRDVQARISEAGAAAGADARIDAGYPGWEPRENSALVDSAIAAYRRAYGREPLLAVLHGGLECGVIVAKKPELDAVSFGPRIEGAHTPGETVHASTVAETYRLLAALLAELARPAR